jgi:hypothetical protein
MHLFLKIVAKTLSQHPAVCLLFLLSQPFALSSQTHIATATIDTSKTGAPISKNIYGQFLEHGGDIVNTGVWSEMLVDRKFFSPVATTVPTPPAVMGNSAGNPRVRRTPTRWWAPIGGDGVVTMDAKAAYTGDHSPLVKVDAKEPHGFKQSGIAVRKGKAYTGQIVLAGSSGTVIKVSLIWGKEAAERQTITLRTLGAVGDIDKRPPIFDPVWHAVQPNDVGTDEFLTLCRLLGVDPYITVNAGFGDAWSARELVEYTNGAASTPMGKWRAANGNPASYHVKWWGVGNEPWGDYQMGAMSLPQFELKHNLFAKEMKMVDPSIKLIAAGAMPDVMEGADQSRRINGQYVPDYLSPADWTGQMLLNCLENIDMVSEHYYASGTQHTDMKLQKKVPIDPPLSLIEWERAPAVQVRAKFEHYQEYLKRIPALRAKPVPSFPWARKSSMPRRTPQGPSSSESIAAPTGNSICMKMRATVTSTRRASIRSFQSAGTIALAR